MLFLACSKDKPVMPTEVAKTAPIMGATTLTASTSTSATIAGIISKDGGSAVTERGICYGSAINPTITPGSGSVVVPETPITGTAPFTIVLTGLTPNTLYHARAYAINSAGTAYGDDVPFTTAPTLTIGQSYKGGIIAHIDAGGQTGLIVSADDLSSSGKTWDAANTLCNNYKAIQDDISDEPWRLPTVEELVYLYNNRGNISSGLFDLNNPEIYWSSAEGVLNQAHAVNFGNSGSDETFSKNTTLYVRAVRPF